jgi:hypothetical protein
MNGGRGIEKGCLFVFFVKGARTAIVYVLTVLETQNLEPDRIILSFGRETAAGALSGRGGAKRGDVTTSRGK